MKLVNTSIKELQQIERNALLAYHEVALACQARIDEIRKQRGTKLKTYENDPNWIYADPGRNRIPETPYG